MQGTTKLSVKNTQAIAMVDAAATQNGAPLAPILS
jgi:hypothetical protein